MKTLYTGSDNAMNFIWIEDNDTMKCAMVDWDISEAEIDKYAEEFREEGLESIREVIDFNGGWRDGIFAIREEMNGFTEIAWHC